MSERPKMQEYREVGEQLKRGDYTTVAQWEKFGPLEVLNEGGRVVIGDVKLHDAVRIQVGPGGFVEIGDYTHINTRTEIHCRNRVVIGRYCAISWDVVIMDTDYHGVGDNPPVNKPTILEDAVWVGNGAIILKGVTVGKGSIISAGSVVVRDVPPFSVVGGIPGKVVKQLEPFEGKHGQLYETKWWDPAYVPLQKPQE